MEKVIENEAALRHILDGITFAPSCLDMGWAWEIDPVYVKGINMPRGVVRGWLVNTTFRRPDTHTGEIGTGTGRKEFIAFGSTESAVVKTAWLLAELIVRHELMEAFLYKGVRVFDPHKTVEDLSYPARPDGSYERPYRTIAGLAKHGKPVEPYVIEPAKPEDSPLEYVAVPKSVCSQCGKELTFSETVSQLLSTDVGKE